LSKFEFLHIERVPDNIEKKSFDNMQFMKYYQKQINDEKNINNKININDLFKNYMELQQQQLATKKDLIL
jgi:hypothetical protein